MKRALIFLVATSCYNPTFPQGILCSAEGECPDGQMCAADNRCYAPGNAPDAGTACMMDMECPGADDPEANLYCVSGACVECRNDDNCTEDAPVCDQETHACRGCTSDSECESDVCIEAEGRCAADSEVIYLTTFGSDTGECSRDAPCQSLNFGLTKLASDRTVIQLLGGQFSTGSATVTLNGPLIIDGTPTSVNGASDMPVFAVNQGSVVLENLTMKSTTSGPAVTVANLASLQLIDSTVQGSVDVDNASLSVERSTFVTTEKFSGTAVRCTGGTVLIEQSQFDHTEVQTSNCNLTLQRSLFEDENGRSLDVSGGLAIIENNLIVEAYELADVAFVKNTLNGSAVRFNTFVNTSSIDSDGVALGCDTTVEVTSNVFAYRSMDPHGPNSTCQPRYSLYDEVAGQISGVGNKVGDGATFFVDRDKKDFHLAADSPAKDSGEPGLPVDVDYDGAARPQPAGANPDIGAFESP